MRDGAERGDEVVVRNAQIVEQLALGQVPDEQREGFLRFVAADQDSERMNGTEYKYTALGIACTNGLPAVAGHQ